MMKACASPSGEGVLRRRDDQHLADARQHQRGERVVDHRLVVDRQQLLADRVRDRVQARARTTGQDDAAAVHAFTADFPMRSSR